LPSELLNYYTILRVKEDASGDEIKSSYRTLAKEYHPDINPHNIIAEEYFKKINEAYAVLRDPIKRSWYNLLLKGNAVTQNIDPRKYGTRRYHSGATPSGVEREESTTPFWLKQLVPLLSMLWCLLIIYNNWFTTYEGAEAAKIVLAFLLFMVSAYFFINNVYNKWRIKGTSFNPENRSLIYFLLVLFVTIPAFFVIGYTRKSIQLKLYPAITEARVIEHKEYADDYWVSVLYFDKNNMAYTKDFNFNSKIPLKRSEFHIQLLGQDSILQKDIDVMNENENYFIPPESNKESIK
jgi:curved DNA-binding protein CbpA